MSGGISPFGDRGAYRRKMIVVGSLVAVVLTSAAVFVMTQFAAEPEPFGMNNSKPTVSPRDTSASSELASAYQAVQNAVQARLGSQNYEVLDWFEPRHEGHLGWYSYEGRVNTSGWQKQERLFEYAVELELRSDKTWKIVSISIKE